MIQFDTQRNLLTVLLLFGTAFLLLLALLMFLLFGRVNLDSIEAADLPPRASLNVRTPDIGLAELSEFAIITNRPLFFQERALPVIESGEEVADTPVFEESTEEPTPDLNAKVAGIIITPEMKLAMVNDQNSNETLVLSEGMSMQGDMAAWRIEEIRDRNVHFVTDRGEQAELELEVETRALASATPPPRRQNQSAATQAVQPNQSANNQDAEEAARARAEEVRRRVAERRAQLRAEAERRAREQQGGG